MNFVETLIYCVYHNEGTTEGEQQRKQQEFDLRIKDFNSIIPVNKRMRILSRTAQISDNFLSFGMLTMSDGI